MMANDSTPVALVTGASRDRGLGFEVCRQLAARGTIVLLTARDPAKAEALGQRLQREGLDVRPHALDVASDSSVERLAATVRTEFGRLDVLVNNANAVYDAGGKALETDMGLVRKALETNLLGAWRMAKAFAPLLAASPRARIVNVGSGAGTFSDPAWGLRPNQQGVPAYAVSKAALHALTVKLAEEFRPAGVLVNAVCPGFVATYEGTEAYGARPVPEGADGIVWAALLPADGPTGGLFRDGRPIGW